MFDEKSVQFVNGFDSFKYGIHIFQFFFLFAIFIFHSQAMYRFVLDGKSDSLGSCYFRVTCLPHKGGVSS